MSLHFSSSADTRFPTPIATAMATVAVEAGRVAVGWLGDPPSQWCCRGDPANRKGCKQHLQFNRGDLRNFRSIEASLVESTQHVFL